MNHVALSPLTHPSVERAEEFSEDLYADGWSAFCKFCEQSVDFTRVDIVKHANKMDARKQKQNESAGPSSSKQKTLGTILKSKDHCVNCYLLLLVFVFFNRENIGSTYRTARLGNRWQVRLEVLHS